MSCAELQVTYTELQVILCWDFENLPSGNTREDAFNIRAAVEASFPEATLRFRAYANPDHISEDQRNGCLLAGFHITDVPEIPDENPNAVVPVVEGVGDRIIMNDLFGFTHDFAPPAVVMLISGDADFANTMTAITGMDFTTCLLCVPKYAANVLKKAVNYVYDISRVVDLCCFDRPKLRLEPCLGMHISREQTMVFWDLDTVPIPPNLRQTNANFVLNQMIEPHIQRWDGNIRYRVYGTYLPRDSLRAKGVKYIRTSKYPYHKDKHLESTIISDISSFAVYNRPPSNIVVLTNNNILSGTIIWARDKGYRTVVVGAVHRDLVDAASVNLGTPNWN